MVLCPIGSLTSPVVEIVYQNSNQHQLSQNFSEELNLKQGVTVKEFIEAGWPSDLSNKPAFHVFIVRDHNHPQS